MTVPKDLGAAQLFANGVSLLESGDALGALETFGQALDGAVSKDEKGRILYNMAVCNLRTGAMQVAIENLANAVAICPSLKTAIARDPDFQGLHDEEKFKVLLGTALSPNTHTALNGPDFTGKAMIFGVVIGVLAMTNFPSLGTMGNALMGFACVSGGVVLGLMVGFFLNSRYNVPGDTDSITDKSALSVASLAFGIVSLVAWVLPFAGLPIGTVGFAFAWKASHSRQRQRALIGMGLSLAGLLLSVGNSYFGALDQASMGYGSDGRPSGSVSAGFILGHVIDYFF